MEVNKIVETINALSEKFGIAADSAGSYMEALTAKVVAYEIIQSWVCMGVCLAIIIGMLMSFKPLKKLAISKAEANTYSSWYEVFIAYVVISLGIIAIIFGCGIVGQIFDLIKCKTCPELILADLIKSYLNS